MNLGCFGRQEGRVSRDLLATSYLARWPLNVGLPTKAGAKLVKHSNKFGET